MSTPNRLTLTIDTLNSSGEGIARLGRDVYFVAGALPSEKVEVVLDGRRRKVWQTRLLKILSPSEHRVQPPCPHYQHCGGCDLQHLSYDEQVRFKQERVAFEFKRQHIDVPLWLPPIVAEPWHYRRKARVGVRFSANRGENIIGFREASSSHLTNIDHCLVLPEHALLNWQAWRDCIGQLQGRAHITQIEVVVADNALALVLRVIKPLQAQDEQRIASFVSQQSAELSANELPVQLWLKEEKGSAARLLWPERAEPLFHTVDQQAIALQLDDFMQINQQVNQQMVAQAMAWLAPQGHEVVWDMFAGHGNFSIPLAKRVKQVLAFEGSQPMVDSLNQQAEQLGLPITAKYMDLTQPQFDDAKPDMLLLDPPRAGAAELVPLLGAQKLSKVLYVSCDAATLARDLSSLLAAGYQVAQAGIMDMFPQTHHVETMVLLEYKAKRHG